MTFEHTTRGLSSNTERAAETLKATRRNRKLSATERGSLHAVTLYGSPEQVRQAEQRLADDDRKGSR